MTLKSDMASDVANILKDPNGPSETIQYTPFGGSPKSVNAVVNRARPDSGVQDGGHLVGRQAEITISILATDGVASVNKGNDIVSMPIYNGGATNVDWRVIDVLEKDDGAWHLLVQR